MQGFKASRPCCLLSFQAEPTDEEKRDRSRRRQKPHPAPNYRPAPVAAQFIPDDEAADPSVDLAILRALHGTSSSSEDDVSDDDTAVAPPPPPPSQKQQQQLAVITAARSANAGFARQFRQTKRPQKPCPVPGSGHMNTNLRRHVASCHPLLKKAEVDALIASRPREARKERKVCHFSTSSSSCNEYSGTVARYLVSDEFTGRNVVVVVPFNRFRSSRHQPPPPPLQQSPLQSLPVPACRRPSTRPPPTAPRRHKESLPPSPHRHHLLPRRRRRRQVTGAACASGRWCE